MNLSPIIFYIFGVLVVLAFIYAVYRFKTGGIDKEMFISKLILLGVATMLIILFYWGWLHMHHSL